jgi:hypothetical protein
MLDLLFHNYVSYGGVGGINSVEDLRLVMAGTPSCRCAGQVALSSFSDFENFTRFKPAPTRSKH